MRLRLTPLIAALAFALVPTAHAAGITPRIVGGTTSTPGAHPFMAALVVPGFANDADGTFCGATVIAPYAFLTAAHCIIQDQPAPHTLGPGDLIVATGRTDLSVPGGQRLGVRKIVTHPGFDSPYALANDVAVVLTTAPTTSAPVLRASVAPAEGDTGTALGWGATVADPPGGYPAQLQEATLPVLATDTCQHGGIICAGSTSPNICIGDSGGPLLVTTAGVTRLAGVASVILTGSASTPVCGIDSSEFMDVSQYNAWIDAQLLPAVSGVAASAAGGAPRVTGQVATGGFASTVKAEYGLDTAHLTTTRATTLPDAAGAAIVTIPLGSLAGSRTYRARLIAQNSAGTSTSAWITFTTPATRPVATRKPKISGTSRVGKTLTCGVGTWTAAPAPTYSYAWRIGGKVSKTQKKSRLKLTNAMLGKSVSCAVTAKNPAAAVTVRSAAVTVRHR